MPAGIVVVDAEATYELFMIFPISETLKLDVPWPMFCSVMKVVLPVDVATTVRCTLPGAGVCGMYIDMGREFWAYW